MQTEIVIFVACCLAAALILIVATTKIVGARWQKKVAQALAKEIENSQEAIAEAKKTRYEHVLQKGIQEGKRLLAAEIGQAESQKQTLWLSTHTSTRGRVRVRLVETDGEVVDHVLLQSPAGYGTTDKAHDIIKRIMAARLVVDAQEVT